MYTHISAILEFMLTHLLTIWPYLLITIPLAVAVQLSGASKQIQKAFQARPLIAILLATAVGAFSPFCSCSVIPVVASLLIGGVPLAPVMAFWIASPSMDPEIFFLSVSMIGWELAIWRLAATVGMSLIAGYVTHYLMQRRWLGTTVLRAEQAAPTPTPGQLVRRSWQWVQVRPGARLNQPASAFATGNAALATSSCCATPGAPQQATSLSKPAWAGAARVMHLELAPVAAANSESCCSSQTAIAAPPAAATGASCSIRPPFRQRLLQESWKATSMVLKFMALAFFLEALIVLYIPEQWIAGLLGSQNPWAIWTAALLGVPVYTSNLTALPLVGGLLAQGMHPAAALAFLIAGPTTTLPAMAAVWGLATRRVFALYVGVTLVGAIGIGYLYQFLMWAMV
jgi:uncharacterized protein